MRYVVADLVRTLMGEKIIAFEQRAYALAYDHGGDCIKDGPLRCTFHEWNKKPAYIPPCEELHAIKKEFKFLKKDRDTLYAFVAGAVNVARPHACTHSVPEDILCRYMLPDELRQVLKQKFTLNEPLEKVRQEFLAKHFGFNMRRLLIKYQLFDV